jgi:hypothetical protein
VISDFCVAIDDDQLEIYTLIPGIIYEVNPRLLMNGTLNLVASQYANEYQTITFLGDDHHVQTDRWDEILYATIKERGFGLSYGDDLLQGKNLATAIMMSTNLIRLLGFMAPPKQRHLFMDNFWMLLGQRLFCIDYHPEVIIEHQHYLVGKSSLDAMYAEVNSSEMYQHDQKAFIDYVATDFEKDLERVKKGLSL